MKKILRKINFNNLVIIFILLQPIIDILTSVCVRNVNEKLTVGIFIRTIFMCGICIYSIVKTDKKTRIKLLIYYAVLTLYGVCFLLQCYKDNGTNLIMVQIKGLLKTFYLPVVAIALIAVFKNKKYQVDNKFLIYSLFGYATTIFIAKVLGIAYPSYEPVGYNDGTVGLFFAANEIGAILSILAPVLCIELLKLEFNSFHKVALFFLIYAILEIGTKVPFITLILLAVVCLYLIVLKLITMKHERKVYTDKLISLFLIAIIIYSVFTYTPIGKNLIKNYSQFFNNTTTSTGNGEGEKPQKPKNEINENKVSEVVSNRNSFLQNNLQDFKKKGISHNLLGKGYLYNQNDDVEVNKLVEMDIFDIFFTQGVIGIIIYIIPLLIFCIEICKKIFRNFKKVIQDIESILLMYSLFIGALISVLAGHVLVAPAVAIFVVLILLRLCNRLENIQ